VNDKLAATSPEAGGALARGAGAPPAAAVELDDLAGAPRGEVALFVRRAGDLVRGPAVTCGPATSSADAARLMTREGIGSVIVVGADGEALGIVTDRDLRRRVVARDLAPSTPVATIMSSPVAGIDRGGLAFEALLEMTRRSIHHLAVLDGERLAGVLSSSDIMGLQGAHPVALVRDIERQSSPAGLSALAPRLPAVVRWLFEAGVGVLPIGQIVTEINDRLARRAVALAEQEVAGQGAGPPPVSYSWVALGSEGRREQTLRTDQDNALVYADPSAGDEPAVAVYFGRLAHRVSATLVDAGFPVCAGGFMASNPEWCQPVSAWRGYFDRWMATPRPAALLNAALFFDWRPVAGNLAVAQEIWRSVCEQVPRRTVFLRHMASAAVERRPPIGVFGRLRVERSGPHRGTIDLKARGTFPFTHAIRVHALALGMGETNTDARLTAVGARGVLGAAAVRETREAFEVVCRLRLARQLECLEAGVPADNAVDPRKLGRVDRMLLREAFVSLGSLQRDLEERFQTARLA
jgi:CBS domain-containing protein